jgi:mono/diheme cytochrome c family protein
MVTPSVAFLRHLLVRRYSWPTPVAASAHPAAADQAGASSTYLADQAKKGHSGAGKKGCKSRESRRKSMRRPVKPGAAVLLLVLAPLVLDLPLSASAEGLDDQQTVGMGLFNQHCRVCHTKPLLTGGQYGPVLSKSSLGGDDRALHDFVANGTSRMPGFKYSFKPAEIDAVVAFLKTVPAPSAAAQ